MAARVERRGRDYFATRLAHDVEYGVSGRPLRVIPGEQSRSPNCCSTARPSSRSLPPRRLGRPTTLAVLTYNRMVVDTVASGRADAFFHALADPTRRDI